MDDPWGSPWASTDAPSDNDPPPSSRTNAFLSPPPKAFFGNGTQSPWAGNRDEDGLNIWTAADRADGVENQNEWGGWAESGVQQPPRLSPRLSTSGRESPLAWPENVAASPVFLGNSRSRTPSILRHNSPDPWAAELSLTNRSNVELPNPLNATTGDTPTIETEQVEQTPQASRIVPAIGIREKKNDERPRGEEGFALEAGAYVDDNAPKTSLDLVHEDTNAGSKQSSTVEEHPSRPSSRCTIDSHEGLERQDSPITSIDEERSARIQNNLRKTSGKVQELVGKYDGLARAASEERPNFTGDEISRERSEIEDEGDGAGFGDFEDAPANAERVIGSPGESSLSSGFLSTPKAESKDRFSRKLPHEGEGVTNVAVTPHTQPQKAANKFRHLSFDTNLAGLDKLFPNLPGFPTSGSIEDREISDYVVDDSFETISERKSWYRISRYGSMRKHNSGDEENYHRVTWQTSQLHDDTIKIVRRWMEEDSYAGKATLGGTKRTGFFDWDSDAAPVKLDEVFRRKKSVTKHTRTTSIPATNASIQSVSVVDRPYRNSTGISLPTELSSITNPIMPVPSFGWNSQASAAHSLDSISQVMNSAPIPAPAPPTAAGERPSHRPEPIQVPFTDEDEDDWGEMVSSPRVAEAHIEPSISAFPISQIHVVDHERTTQTSLAIFDTDHPMGLKPPTPKTSQPASSDPWAFSDFSILDKPKQSLDTPSNHASQTRETSTVLTADISLPRRGSLEAPRNETGVPLKGTKGISEPFNPPRSNHQDDIIVQRILQNLPDLSYMLK